MYRTRLRHWRQNRLVSIVGASVLWVLASGSALAASVPTMTSPSQPNVIRTGPGGYSYPPNSIFYIFQNYRGSNGVDVPYRQGQDQASSGVGPFGLLHVLYKHSTATSIVAQTVEYGEAEPFYNNLSFAPRQHRVFSPAVMPRMLASLTLSPLSTLAVYAVLSRACN